MGNFPGRFLDQQWDQFTARIEDHLNKADYVPVDVSQSTPQQVTRVRAFIAQFGPRVFIVGE